MFYMELNHKNRLKHKQIPHITSTSPNTRATTDGKQDIPLYIEAKKKLLISLVKEKAIDQSAIISNKRPIKTGNTLAMITTNDTNMLYWIKSLIQHQAHQLY